MKVVGRRRPPAARAVRPFGRLAAKDIMAKRVVTVSPEHDDCAAVAGRTGSSVKSIWAEALAAAHRL